MIARFQFRPRGWLVAVMLCAAAAGCQTPGPDGPADSFGLASVRIVSGGKVIKEIDARGAPLVEATLVRKATGRPAYYRLECTANDDRRAFSAPIYVR